MSKIFSIFNSKVINYGVEKIFEEKKISNSFIDNKVAYFTSRQDRNLEYLIKTWKEFISPKRMNFRLYVTPLNEDLTKFNIYNRKMLSKNEYIDDLIKARMLILPGHKAELFCLSALKYLNFVYQ